MRVQQLKASERESRATSATCRRCGGKTHGQKPYCTAHIYLLPQLAADYGHLPGFQRLRERGENSTNLEER